MTTAETVRRLLLDAAGEPLCDSCLASPCSVSLAEMCRVTEELLTNTSFHRHDRCVSCRHTTPAIAYAPKCIHCSRPVVPGEDALEIDADIFHAACLKRLSSDEIIRISRKLDQASQRRIVESQRRMREHGRWDQPSN